MVRGRVGLHLAPRAAAAHRLPAPLLLALLVAPLLARGVERGRRGGGGGGSGTCAVEAAGGLPSGAAARGGVGPYPAQVRRPDSARRLGFKG